MQRIEISAPAINVADAMDDIRNALESGQIAQGPLVARTEEETAKAFDASHAILLNNGTASLRAGLIAAIAAKHDVKPAFIDRYMPGSEVIIPAFSFNATLNTVLQTGATARVVDISREDFGVDPRAAENNLTKRTSAIIPVDLYGQPATISSQDPVFGEIAVVRDAAQAHGAKLNGEPIVKHGNAVSLSFYPTKNISAPEGGAVITDNQEIDHTVRIYRNQGMSARYVYDMMGDNLRMTDIHAAILRANLGSLAVVTARRQQNATNLTERLERIEGISVPRVLPGREHVWHQYTVLIEDDFGMTRDELAAKLNQNGIGNGIYYPKTMIDHETFNDHPRIIHEPTPVAEEVAGRVLSLPVHPGVTEANIDRIAETIENIRTGKL